MLNRTLLNLLLKNIVKSESTRDKAGFNGGSYLLFGVREENIANLISRRHLPIQFLTQNPIFLIRPNIFWELNITSNVCINIIIYNFALRLKLNFVHLPYLHQLVKVLVCLPRLLNSMQYTTYLLGSSVVTRSWGRRFNPDEV